MAAEPHPWLMPLHRRDRRARAGAWRGSASRPGWSPAACGSGSPSGSPSTASGTSSCPATLSDARRRMTLADAVVAHYGSGDLLGGSRPRCATPARTRRGRRVDDLAGVDEFHSRGREATRRARRAAAADDRHRAARHRQRPRRPGAVPGGDARPAGGRDRPHARICRRRRRADAPLRARRPGALPDRRRARPAVRRRQLRRRLHAARGDEHRRTSSASTPRSPGCCAPAPPSCSTTSCRARAGRSATRRRGRRTARPASWSIPPACAAIWPTPGSTVQEERDRRAESLAWFEARAAAAAARAGRRRSACAWCSARCSRTAFANLIANLEAATVVPTFVRAVRR